MATPDAVRNAPPEESSSKQRPRAGNYSGRLLLRLRSRRMTMLLAANLVLVGIAAVAAIAFLTADWLS